jgi:putative endonuclease
LRRAISNVIPAQAGIHFDQAPRDLFGGKAPPRNQTCLAGIPYLETRHPRLKLPRSAENNRSSFPSGKITLKDPCVYILASGMRGTLYIGVTSDLAKRIWQHRNDFVPGFTNKYRVHELVWFEQHATMGSAIHREKALKEWRRMWKIRLVEESNPNWLDRSAEIAGI